MLDRQRWQRLWLALGASVADWVLFAQLQASYAEPGRAYHNTQHILNCLAYFDTLPMLAEQPTEIEIAIWFHDALYDPQQSDNEVRSAEWARHALRTQAIPTARAHRVYDLILATKHDTPPATLDAALLIDIDLAILGQSPAHFAAYDQAIRQEYAWVPDATFRTRRSAVLQHFLDRTRIYQTDYFYTHFEEQARRNLAHAIGQLRS